MSYVKINNIEKNFNNLKVLNNISFSIEKGEFLTLLGPSGCGKSTLLKIIAGLNDFDGGNIIIDDIDVTNIKPKDRQVAMVFQSYALFPNMTVYENIEFGLRMKKLDKKEVSRKVTEIIEVVDLKGKENNYPSELSGGQQQRVALARSIVTEPKILLLDEPLSALDAKIRKSLQRQIRKIQKELNITTIFVTHDQEEAMTMSDRIIIMDKGNIAQIGAPEEIYISPANEFVARFIGNYNVYSSEESEVLFDGAIRSAIAIRPELITINSSTEVNDNYYCIEADLINKYMAGSIIRYELAKNNLKILVDVLNKSPSAIENKVLINIPKNDIIYLEENNEIKVKAVV